MMNKPQFLRVPGAPQPRGPFSHAVRAGDFLFISGQGPIDLATDDFSFGDIQHETRLTLECIRHILQSCGARMEDVVKCSVYLTDPDDFQAMNEVYREFFPSTAPARTMPLGEPRLPAQNSLRRQPWTLVWLLAEHLTLPPRVCE